MHRPTIAVRWEAWRRHRWKVIAGTIWFLAVLSLCHAISDGVMFGMALLAREQAAFLMLVLVVSHLVCGLIPLFAYAVDVDLASRSSTFPARMLILPLTTRASVGWPMIYGTSAIALAWVAVVSLVLRPGGLDVPLWWPAALLASCLAWVQATVWRPFGLPWLRIVFAVVPISVLVAVASLRWMAQLPEAVVALLIAGTIPPAYIVAVRGVARARRGDQPDWQWLVARARRVALWLPRNRRPLASPSAAQVWFESRQTGLATPILIGLMILFMTTFITVNRYNSQLDPTSPLRSPILLLVIPLLATVSLGSAWGRYEDSRGGPSIRAFLATRPMTCAGLIWAKMKASATSAVVAWAMTLAAVVLLVLLTGSWAELASHWNMLTKDVSLLKKVAIAIVAGFFLLAGTWRSMIVNLYFGLAGRQWVWTVGNAVMGVALIAIIPLGCWFSAHPEYHPALWTTTPWLLGSAAVLKLALAGWSLRVLNRQRLVATPLLTRLLGAWLLITVCLIALLCWLVPAALAPWYLVTSSVVLAMPLVRLSWAPLALAWNRHR